MKYLNLTLKTPEENLACDEALLNACEGGDMRDEILRVWEPSQYFVVLGYSNRAQSEVNEPAAKKSGMPILRRVSGGGTVLQGPGCLNYSLILRIDQARELGNLIKTNHYILNKHQQALRPLVKEKIEIQGISDLAVNSKKFSGNAQRRKQKFLLYHGTFLIDFNIGLIEKILLMPSKKPEYRNNRSHTDFLMNLKIPAEKIKQALQDCWNAHEKIKGVSS